MGTCKIILITCKIILIGFIAILYRSILIDGDKIGVNYGMLGDNLPAADQVVSLMKKNNMGKARIFEANKDALKALANSGIDVIMGVGNGELQAISSSQDTADAWVKDNIVSFYPATSIKYIAVGNEVLSSSSMPYSPYLLPAMTNIQTAIQKANLQNNIKVSTAHAMSVIGNSFPPSQGSFTDDLKDTMSSMLKFLSNTGAPLMANVYPYFTYFDDRSISLDYALFKSTAPVVQDAGRCYGNLFEGMVDSILSAMEALGYPNIPLIVTESGWPSAGGETATVENAQTYNNNLIQYVLSNEGTPKRPGLGIETYIFALFNEENKVGYETERHFGLFNPDQTPAYHVNFSP